MQCINCGFENVPGLTVCVRCQSSLSLAGVPVEPPRRRRGPRGWLTHARWGLRQMFRPRHRPPHAPWDLPRIRRDHSRSTAVPVIAGANPWPWPLLAWCLLPGLGQIRSGQRLWGRAILVGWSAMMLLAVLSAGSSASWLLYAGILGIHCLSIAFLTAPLLQGRGLGSRLAVGVATFLALHLVYYGTLRWLASGLADVVELNNILQTDLLHDGDAVLCRGRFLGGRQPRRGDIVVYEVPAMGGGHAYTEAGLGIDRVLGVPGDHVRVQKGRVLVNDAELAAADGPVGPLGGWAEGIDLAAGPGEYIILPSVLSIRQYGNAMQPFVVGWSRVPGSRILGKVVWRVRPWDRMGRLEK